MVGPRSSIVVKVDVGAPVLKQYTKIWLMFSSTLYTRGTHKSFYFGIPPVYSDTMVP